MSIGERIKEKRAEKGWSQRELAAKLGYTSHTTLAKIELGKVNASYSRIVQLAEVLNVSAAYLLEEDISKTDKKSGDIKNIVAKLETDNNFLSVVETLYKLDSDKLNGVSQMLNAFLK